MSKGTVLICDDNEAIYRSIAVYLENDGISVLAAYNGENAIEIMRRTNVDIILLDIMMPGMDGYSVCEAIRRNNSEIHIIMLSAKISESDRLFGLEIGADDYIPKPFSPREVAVKIKKILNRIYPKKEPRQLSIAELCVYPESSQVFVKGQEVHMSAKEVSLLSYMLINSGKVLSRDLILNAVWGYDFFGDTRVVDIMINKLRQKLISDDVHFSIQTIYGAGYKIEERI